MADGSLFIYLVNHVVCNLRDMQPIRKLFVSRLHIRQYPFFIQPLPERNTWWFRRSVNIIRWESFILNPFCSPYQIRAIECAWVVVVLAGCGTHCESIFALHLNKVERLLTFQSPPVNPTRTSRLICLSLLAVSLGVIHQLGSEDGNLAFCYYHTSLLSYSRSCEYWWGYLLHLL